MIKVERKPWPKKRAKLEKRDSCPRRFGDAISKHAQAMLDLAVEADDEDLLVDVQS